ncbi:hypothetical protein ACSBR1_005790 [Camellia fascicularis]
MQILLRLLFLFFFLVESQSTYSQVYLTSTPNVATNFQASLAVVIGVLAIMFSITIVLLIYARFCRQASPIHNNQQNLDRLLRPGSRFSGIDKTVIESLPFFRFSSLRGLKEGLECSVCLCKFEDIEILRLLPKCKHTFHIDCVDQWLENHSSCPLCRHKISTDDLEALTYSNSLRFLWNKSERQGGDSNLELFVQREENHRHGSTSRFSSFRKVGKREKEEEELPIQENCTGVDDNLHKFKHKIIVPDGLIKNRWSNVSSSDLMFLNSEMISAMSSDRFTRLDSKIEESTSTRGVEDGDQIMKIKDEIGRKRVLENKVSKMNQNEFSKANPLRGLNLSEKRSMSEITVHPRFTEFSRIGTRDSSSLLPENVAEEEKMKRLWLPIARRTVQWFANRETRSQEQSQNTRHSLNV